MAFPAQRVEHTGARPVVQARLPSQLVAITSNYAGCSTYTNWLGSAFSRSEPNKCKRNSGFYKEVKSPELKTKRKTDHLCCGAETIRTDGKGPLLKGRV